LEQARPANEKGAQNWRTLLPDETLRRRQIATILKFNREPLDHRSATQARP
jgi:hypothetical protein